jgi:hypothetical protein
MVDETTPTGQDAQVAIAATKERDEALDRVLGRREIRRTVERIGVSNDQVREKVLPQLARQGVSGIDELLVSTADESSLETVRFRSWRLTSRVLTANVAAVATAVGAGSALVLTIVSNARFLNLDSTDDKLLIYTIGGAIFGGTLLALFSQLSLRSETVSKAREAVTDKRAELREQLDAQVERFVRRALNELAQTTFSRRLHPLDTSGLRDMFDSSYDVSTIASEALKQSLAHLQAGSLGIAGPRGAGKSTLLRRAVDGRLDWARSEEPLGVEVHAPVRYEAREFVPHLFSKLCLTVLGPRLDARWLERASKQRRDTQMRIFAVLIVGACGYLVIAKVLDLRLAIPVAAAAIVATLVPEILGRLRLGSPDDSLEGLARANLDRLRFLETKSEEWSSELSSTAAKLASRREVSRAAQPWTMPEMIGAYRDFVRRITETRAMIVGIDELDKMASVEEAQRFLNEIKALFGQSRTYYLVTLSDDAMSAFESRGLPLRDVFESVFDDVLRVEPLSLTESAAVLRERTVGVAPPFVGLCHAVSGGLPRELIRTARAAVRIAADTRDRDLSNVARRLLVDRTSSRQLAAEVVARRHVGVDGTQPVVSWLRGLRRDPTAPDLLEWTEVEPVLSDLLAVNGVGGTGLQLLVAELATAAYHAASAIEFFSVVDEASYREATLETGEQLNVIEVLSGATRDLAVAPHVAWESTSEFRRRAGLPALDYPLRAAGAPLST